MTGTGSRTPTGSVEQRLTDALHARAEQLRPEQLRPLAAELLPQPTQLFGREHAQPDVSAGGAHDLVAAQLRRRHRRIAMGWATAAAVVAVLVWSGSTGLMGGRTTAQPADDGDGLGPLVQTGISDNGMIPLESFPSSSSLFTGARMDGAQLCIFIRSEGSDTSGCLEREPRAADPGVAIDWFFPQESEDNPTIIGAVDARVETVQVWFTDGTQRQPRLVDLGRGRRAFGVTLPGGAARQQRIVAFDARGRVLQTRDLSSSFEADDTVGPHDACAGDPVASTNGPGLTVELGTRDARVRTAAGDTCSGDFTDGSLVWSTRVDGKLVAVVGPEVQTLHALLNEKSVTYGLAKPSGSPWRVAIIDTDPKAELIPYDASDHPITVARR